MREELCAHINDLDEKSLTPLHYAARYSHLAMMKLLIELGADVNKRGDDNMTPLHYAARYAKKASASALRALRMRQERRLSVSPGGTRRRKSSVNAPGAAELPAVVTPTSAAGSPAASRRASDAPDFEGLSPATATTIQVIIVVVPDFNYSSMIVEYGRLGAGLPREEKTGQAVHNAINTIYNFDHTF